jgi:hypothetical protein
MSVRGGTYDEQDDQKERLEIEEGGLLGRREYGSGRRGDATTEGDVPFWP